MGDKKPAPITPTWSLSPLQKQVLMVYMSEGGYVTAKTVLILKQKYSIEVTKGTLLQWLRAEKCQDYLEKLQREMGVAIRGIAVNTIQELAMIAASDIGYVFSEVETAGILNVDLLKKMDPSVRRGIKTITFMKNGKGIQKIEMHSKMDALKELSRISNPAKIFDEADEQGSRDGQVLTGVTIIRPVENKPKLLMENADPDDELEGFE